MADTADLNGAQRATGAADGDDDGAARGVDDAPVRARPSRQRSATTPSEPLPPPPAAKRATRGTRRVARSGKRTAAARSASAGGGRAGVRQASRRRPAADAGDKENDASSSNARTAATSSTAAAAKATSETTAPTARGKRSRSRGGAAGAASNADEEHSIGARARKRSRQRKAGGAAATGEASASGAPPAATTTVTVSTLSHGACAALLGGTARDPLMQVLRVSRFMTDERYEQVAAMVRDPAGDAFDITLSDGECKLKCLLASALNVYAKRGLLREFDVIKINRSTLRFDEMTVGSEPMVVIEEIEGFARTDERTTRKVLRCNAQGWVPPNETPDALVPILPKQFPADYDAPLIGDRSYYIALGDNGTPCGNQWRAYNVRAAEEFRVGASQQTVAQIISRVNKRRDDLPPYLVGRVIQKTNLVHYAQPGKRDRYPFNFTLTVADSTAQCNVVVWTSLCYRYFHSVHLGDLVAVEGFRVQTNKLRRPLDSAPPPGAPASERLDEASARVRMLGPSRAAAQHAVPSVEVALNPTNPDGRIRVLNATQLELSVSPMLLNLVTIDALELVPAFAEIDLCGVVTFVGRIEMQRARVDSATLLSHRWLRVRDLSTSASFAVKWHCNGRDDVLRSLQVGQCVGLTDMKVLRLTSRDTDVRGVVFCKSTYQSQLLDATRLQRIASAQRSVGDVADWADATGAAHWQAAHLTRRLHHTVFVDVPPRCALQTYADLLDARMMLLTELEAFGDSLLLHEHVTVLVQARIAAVRVEFRTPDESAAPIEEATTAGARRGVRFRERQVEVPVLHDVVLTLVNLNGTHRADVRVPEGVYSDGSDRREESMTRQFAAWAARGAIDEAALSRLATGADNAALTRPLVCAITMCREAHTVTDAPDISMACVALFDAETCGTLADRRD